MITSPRRRLRTRPLLLQDGMPAPQSGASPVSWDAKIASLDARVDSFEVELRRQGRQQEEGFERVDRNFAQLFARVDGVATRPVPWGIIVSGLVGIGTMGLTGVTALALWANAYFGSAIRQAESRAREAHERLDKTTDAMEGRMDKMREFQWETRSLLLTGESQRLRQP